MARNSIIRNELYDWERLPRPVVEKDYSALYKVLFDGKPAAKVKARRTRIARDKNAPSKQDIATEIVQANFALGKSKLIEMIIDKCSMSHAGAQTYYYNAVKRLKEK